MARQREFDEREVIDRAMDTFWVHGFRATTPAMLVDATGLSKSSLYATFSSKRGLFHAALDRYLELQVAMMGPMLEGLSLRAGLERVYATMVSMATSETPRSCLVCSSSMELPEDDADSLARVAAGHAQMRALFAARFARAQREGELAADADPEALASYLVSANMGLQVTARANPDPALLRQVADHILSSLPLLEPSDPTPTR